MQLNHSKAYVRMRPELKATK